MRETKIVRVVAWNEAEGAARSLELEAMGHTAVFEAVDPGKLLRTLREEPPRVLVIDLSLAPAQGRDVGVAVRVQKSTRWIPLVFAGGQAEKVDKFRKVLPDAAFVPWEEIGPAIHEALTNPPKEPVVPGSRLAGYSGTPLPKKLGIKPSTRVLLAGAPEDFPKTLGALPDGVELVRRFGKNVHLILWFVRSHRELVRDVGKWAARVGPEGIWIIWPKKSSGLRTDVDQALVRWTGLDAGLVDYKIAAVDQTWSGLKFAVRKRNSGSG